MKNDVLLLANGLHELSVKKKSWLNLCAYSAQQKEIQHSSR